MDEPNLDWTGVVAERRIKEAMDAGEFDDLPGRGQPLQLEEDPFTPPEMRVANRLLRNQGALPEWLQIEKDIASETAALGPARERGLRMVRFARSAASRQRAADRLRSDYKDRLDLVNALVFKYNYVTPGGAQRAFRTFRVRQEMDALEADIRAAVSEAAPTP